MTPDTRTALEKIRKFIEYARYELQPGPPVFGTQFPTQVCADKELARIDALLSTSPGEPCIGHDPLCPCQDGDSCHYVDTKDTKAWPIPETPS